MKKRDVEEKLRAFRVPAPPQGLRARVLSGTPAVPPPRHLEDAEGERLGWGLEIALAAAAALLIVASLAVDSRGLGGRLSAGLRLQPMPEWLAAEGIPPRWVREEPNKPSPWKIAGFESLESAERSEQ
jgi:hypothetical protein